MTNQNCKAMYSARSGVFLGLEPRFQTWYTHLFKNVPFTNNNIVSRKNKPPPKTATIGNTRRGGTSPLINISAVGCESTTSTMPLWDGKFYDRPSMLGIHWIKSLMTCYLAATRRWITRTKLPPPLPPHTGPSENNAILEDQLKTHRRRQTQTKKTQTNTHWS